MIGQKARFANSRAAALPHLAIGAALAVLTVAPAVLPSAHADEICPAGSPNCNTLSAAEVMTVVKQAAVAIDNDTQVIAVADRPGNVLAVWEKPGVGAMAPQVRRRWRDRAISLARTAAFFSNNMAPLSSRTVRFISGVHFPPGIANTQAADLYGIDNTNRGCVLSTDYKPGKAFPVYLSSDGASTGLGISTGKADIMDRDSTAVNGAGIPLFKPPLRIGEFFTVVGGVGVYVGHPSEAPGDITGLFEPPNRGNLALAEYAAQCGAGNPERRAECPDVPGASPGTFETRLSFLPDPAKIPHFKALQIFMAGIRLPFLKFRKPPRGSRMGTFTGSFVAPFTAQDGAPAPEGWLVGPNASADGLLTAADVEGIVARSRARANKTRAAIRLPLNSRCAMMIAVGDLDGKIIGLFRMHDSTIFSVDVSVSKARNVVYFSDPGRSQALQNRELHGVPLGTAMTNRTIEFGAEPFFPSGIEGTGPGPFFKLFKDDVKTACSQGEQPPGPNRSGIVFFPGALPLYRNGRMIGGLGVSGDGVDQDDYVTAGGAKGFEAPDSMRADQVVIDGVRLPYIKFPRNPEK